MPKNMSKQDEKLWNDAKILFKKSYKKEPTEDFEFAIVNTIFKKIKQGTENYSEGFIDELKGFLLRNLNNPILTILIVKYISKLVGRQKILVLKERVCKEQFDNIFIKVDFPDKTSFFNMDDSDKVNIIKQAKAYAKDKNNKEVAIKFNNGRTIINRDDLINLDSDVLIKKL